MAKYIVRERIEKFFDSIYDCADLIFEPNDHCCAADDCAHCKWYEVKNAIQKRVLSIPTADVRPVVRGKWIDGLCSNCGGFTDIEESKDFNFCPNCGADMRWMENEKA